MKDSSRGRDAWASLEWDGGGCFRWAQCLMSWGRVKEWRATTAQGKVATSIWRSIAGWNVFIQHWINSHLAKDVYLLRKRSSAATKNIANKMFNCQSLRNSIPSLLIIKRLPSSPFSTTPLTYKRPVRPEPIGEVVAHYPQQQKTEHIRESKERFASRWQKYVKKLGSVATPKKLGGRDFGSKVRPHPGARREDDKKGDW